VWVFTIHEYAPPRVKTDEMPWLEDLARDARHGLRALGRAPGFAAVAVLTLALGIGANTAVFSVIYGVWLAPVRYAHPDRLVDVSTKQLSGRRFEGGASLPNLADWKAQNTVFTEFGLHRSFPFVNITGAGEAEEATALRVSANLFLMLGAVPALGRALDADADRGEGQREALIAYSWWQRRFGGDPRTVGSQLSVDGQSYTIAGVMPRGFQFPPMWSGAHAPVIWTSLNVPPEERRQRDSHSFNVVGRLKPGVPLSRAQAEMDTIAARLARAWPAGNGGWGIKLSRLNDTRQLDDVRPAFLLPIANLLLARAAGREREMAIRRALGANWRRLARQFLAESAVLALAGGAAGVLIAFTTLPAIKALLPAGMPRADEIEIKGTVLAFAAATSFITALVFGLAPALGPAGGAGAGFAVRSRASRLFVTVEVALAMTLLAVAGLLIESFRRVSNVDLGFRKEHVLTMRLQLTKSRYPDGARVAAFHEELLRRAQALPGVQLAGIVSSLPMGIIMQGVEFEIEGRPETSREKLFVDYATVSPDYLRAMGIPLVRGRYFNADDGPGAPPIVLVSEDVARTYWPDGRAFGSRIRFDDTWFTIAGIVKDVRQMSPERGARGGTIYALNRQLPLASQGNATARLMVLVIRTPGDPGPIASAMRRAVAEIDKDQPVADVSTMEQIVWRTLAARRLNTLLVSLFAALAVLLAAVGVFGVVAYSVARRTKEIGIRMALGARPAAVLAMVTKETLAFGAIGAVAGVAAALATSRLIAGFLYGVKPADPAIVGGVAVALLAVVALSGLIPALRSHARGPSGRAPGRITLGWGRRFRPYGHAVHVIGRFPVQVATIIAEQNPGETADAPQRRANIVGD
jgi:predicted permease